MEDTKIADVLKTTHVEEHPFVITIARGFGSGGKELGMRLAEELGIACYENRILALASKITGKETAELIEIDEKLRQGLMNSILRKMPGHKEPNPVEKKFESDEEIFETQCNIIKHLARTESCIIIGKCADFVLKDFDNVVALYVEAPRPYCRSRIMKRLHVTADEADALIEKTDKYRADYYKYYTGGNYWTNPVNYDMTLNMDRVGEDRAVAMIKDYLNLRFGSEVLEEAAKNHQSLYTTAGATLE